jgi:ribokinase
MGARIAVVGSNNLDLITYVDRMPVAGETIEASSFAMEHGGKGANQAVAAARLGAEVLMVSKIGDDAFGPITRRNFQQHGIDTRHVGVAPGVSSGVAPIFVEPSGENRILIVKGANDQLLPEDIDRAAADLAGCDLILLQLEIPLQTVYHTIALAAAQGTEVLLNPAPAHPDLDLLRLRHVSFLVPNQTELALLSKMPVATVGQIEAAARRLLAGGIRTVIVTMGGDGALLVTGAETRAIPPVRVQPVDTTGAGDAFIGSFARHYVESRDVVGALGRAARYAACSITRRGTQSSYVDAAEFDMFCKRIDHAPG